MKKKPLATIRREYGQRQLTKTKVLASPIQQFEQWFDDVLQTETMDPTSMTLATVDEHGAPDIRVVLLKDIVDDGFVFYSNYQSAKGQQLSQNDQVALNFYWPLLTRQVRIRGRASQMNRERAAYYFSLRPRGSQISASASPQSQVITDRQYLEETVAKATKQFHEQTITCPEEWGAYHVVPEIIEFWQGRDSRLHDRLRYVRDGNEWRIERLAP